MADISVPVQWIARELGIPIVIAAADFFDGGYRRGDSVRNDAIRAYCGSSAEKKLRDLLTFVVDALKDDRDALNLEFHLQLQRQKYQKIIEHLNKVQECYDVFISNKCEDTWKAFSEQIKSTLNRKKHVKTLYEWITKTTIARSTTLADDIYQMCDKEGGIEVFEKWKTDILHRFAQADLLQTIYHFYNTFPRQRQKDNSSRSAPLQIPHDWNMTVPDSVQTESALKQWRTEEIIQIMNVKLLELKTSFLRRTCGNKKHEHCGADNDQQCCELNAVVYRHLRNQETFNNDILAKRIADDLRIKYGHFLWSVAVVPDYLNIEMQFNHEHHDEIWFQRSGTKQLVEIKPRREKSVMFHGLGGYGCFVCYRNKMTWEKAAVVFWADRARVKKRNFTEEYRILEKVLDDHTITHDHLVTPKKRHTTNDYWITGTIKENKMDYMYWVGLRGDNIGLDLSQEGGTTFPLKLGEPIAGACILVWLEPSEKFRTPPAITFVEPEGELVNLASYGSRNKVTIRKISGADGQQVAVKNVLLETNEHDRQKQLRKFDSEMRLIQGASHPNVVQYHGTQFTVIEMKQFYQIIMEFCSGESLTKRVQGNLTFRELLHWSSQILSGLDYMHSQMNMAHQSLQGNHIMLHRDRPDGTSNVKIISLDCKALQLSGVGRSHDSKADPSFDLFQWPHTDRRIGSKSDMWSFGCVLIQMIRGRLTHDDLQSVEHQFDEGRRETVERLKFPNEEEMPNAHVRDVIEKCLSFDYDKRPAALTIIGLRTLEVEYNSQIQWSRGTVRSSSEY